MFHSKRTFIFLAAVVFVVSLLSYCNNLGHDWAYDDIEYIANNTYVTDSGHIGDIFTTTYLFGADNRQTALYRPLTILSYAANRAVTGMSPGAFHAVNDIIHAINSVLVMDVVSFLPGGAAIAFPAALLFATHPLHTEAVDNTVGRAELLALMFMLLSLMAYMRRERNRAVWYPLSLMCFFAALLAKETPAVLPAILAAVAVGKYLRGESIPWKTVVIETGGFFAVLAIYMIIRHGAVVRCGVVAPAMMHDNPLASLGFFDRLPTALETTFRYLMLLVFPVTLSADYSFNQIPVASSLMNTGSLAGAALVAGVLAVGLLTMKRSEILFMGILLLAAPFLVVSNILFPIGTIMGERLMYIPSAGYVIILAWAVWRVFDATLKKPRLAAAVTIVIALAFAGRTLARNPDWKDNDTIFGKTAVTSPNSVKTAYNYGLVLKKRGDLAGAVEQYRKAVAIWPEHQSAWFNMGNALRESGRLEDAVAAYEQAAALVPEDLGTLKNLALAYRDLKKPDKAVEVFERMARLSPGDMSITLDIGNTWASCGEYDKALEVFNSIVKANPKDAGVMTNIGNVYMIKSDTLSAKGWYEQALIADPSSPAANNAMVGLLIARGGYDEALERIERMSAMRIPVRKSFIGILEKKKRESGIPQ